MRDFLSFIRDRRIVPCLAIGLAVLGAAAAQEQIGNQKDLTKAFSTDTLHRHKLFRGTVQPTKEDAKIAEAAANWYVFRVTYRGVFKFSQVHEEFENEVIEAMKKDHYAANKAFMNMFTPLLVRNMKEVLVRDVKADPTTVINAAMMLPTMAKLKHNDVTDYIIQLAEDGKTSDVVRLYALKALKETFPVTIQPEDVDLTDAMFAARKKRQVKQVLALTQFIERPINIEGMTSQQVAAVYFIRREAIASLANAGSPAVLVFGKKTKTLEGPIAPTLLRVLSGDLVPPPSLPEKVEAAIGLCAMRYPYMPDYVPDAGIQLIGKTLVEFTAEYNKDWSNFTNPLGARRKLPFLPWKGDANRLSAALKDLAKNTIGPKANAQKLDNAAQPIFTSIIGKTPKTVYGRPDPPRVQDLVQLVNSPAFQPKNAAPFNNLKQAAPPP